jgi:hypothetical protein
MTTKTKYNQEYYALNKERLNRRRWQLKREKISLVDVVRLLEEAKKDVSNPSIKMGLTLGATIFQEKLEEVRSGGSGGSGRNNESIEQQ